MLRFMLLEDIRSYDLSSIQTCCIAGEPLNPEVYNQWQEATGLKLYEGFGQSESSVLIANFPWFAPKPGSTGKPASSAASTPKDYTQILHDARSAEDNEYYMIFTKGADGKYTAQYGYSKDYEADQLNDEIANMMMPMLNLEDGMAEDFAASLSTMMVQSYGLAIVKPAEGRTQDVVDALNAYVESEQQSMEHYLEDQYQIAKNAKVETLPSGEVVLVCCEDSDTVLANLKKALAA